MNREQLLAICSLKPRREPVEGLEGVYMKMADHATNQAMIRLNLQGKKNEADRLAIGRFLVNEDGSRIFDRDDDSAIDNLAAAWGSRIFEAFFKANDVSEPALDELEKNSEADRS